MFIVTHSGSLDLFGTFDFFRKALELFSAFHSAKDLVFPNLLASFNAVLVHGVPSLAVNFSTDGGRVDEPEVSYLVRETLPNACKQDKEKMWNALFHPRPQTLGNLTHNFPCKHTARRELPCLPRGLAHPQCTALDYSFVTTQKSFVMTEKSFVTAQKSFVMTHKSFVMTQKSLSRLKIVFSRIKTSFVTT